MQSRPIRIVILGGGTAGWMAANLLAKRWQAEAEVKVIESSDIGTVGVGEGSTPALIAFFRTLGIAEADWMPRCNATYKNGIRFNGWSSRPGFESYFHPFKSEIDGFTTPTFYANTVKRRRGLSVPAHPDSFSLLTHLARHRLAPRAPENFPFAVQYGYHFDAGLLGRFLREHAVGLGVAHLDRKVVDVAVGEDGRVMRLDLEGGETVEGDLFFDASGFRSVIAQEKLGVPFISFEKNLFNDSAVVFPTDADPKQTDAQTVAAALTCGWAWKIPLTNRYGNGYVYSSRYCSADEAEAEFRAYLGLPEDVEARHLKMKVGKVEAGWTSNVIAIGLAQSFIEPLEATALMIVQRTVEEFIKAFEKGGFTARERDAYNRQMSALCEGVRDYIVCHYKVNGRTDTEYWRDNAANDNLSDALRAMLGAWFRGEDLRPRIRKQLNGNTWGDLPWHCLLAGYGCFPRQERLKPVPPAARDLSKVDDFIRRCGLNFKDHRTLLAEHGGASS